MTQTILYLFPDTNLFAQCRALEELDWERWGLFDEVRLIVSRPIQSEIDSHKGKGNDRLASRARSTSSLFKKIILESDGHATVKEGTPSVKLFVSPEFKANPDLADQLDYQFNDDQLVGIAHAFMQAHPGADVRVLTHDTGPMASAKMVGVSIAPIPDDWLLPTATSESDKTINKLQSEIKRLRNVEPQFTIIFTDHEGKPQTKLEREIIVYDALTPYQVKEQIDRIAGQIPIATTFPQPPRPGPKFTDDFLTQALSMNQTYEAPREEEIRKYQTEQYPKWLKSCETVLRNLHNSLQNHNPLAFSFNAMNEGTRPAKDALVTIRAKGELKVAVPDREDERELPGILDLPLPPKAPAGAWASPGLGMFSEKYRALMEDMQGVVSPLPASILHSHLSATRQRDPNGFYWKPRRPSSAVAKFAYECEQWRHGVQPERFSGEIVFDLSLGEVSGALECEIHAENLTDVATLLVPVRITTRRQNIEEIAKNKVAQLIARSHGG